MPRGGARPGAGRPKGSRMEPVRKALRAAVRERLVEVVENGEDPLSVLLAMLKDPAADLQTRLRIAETLLPYTTPRQNGRPPRAEKFAQRPAKSLETPT